MSTFYLVRHGSNDWLGKGLAGRLPDVHLNAEGRAQAERLGKALARQNCTRILSSPLERSLETAEPLSRQTGLRVEIHEPLLEIDFGEWAGKTLADLDPQPHWQRFNSFRSGTRAASGETMIEVQARMVAFLDKVREESPGERVAIFSHGDPIRTVLCYYLGMPIDFYCRLEISPGSYSIVKVTEFAPEILGMNILP